MDEPADVQLLLIGRTGQGRSATGNSILKRNVFKSSSAPTSLTSNIEYGLSEINGRRIKVVDGPGVSYTKVNKQRAVKLLMSSMEHAIDANYHGYDAFILVVKFGEKCTAKMNTSLDVLRNIFGKDFIKDFVILAITCGDLFKQQSGGSRKSIEQWCNENTGSFRDLVNECDRRVVLFDNKATDHNQRDEQVEKLLKIADKLSSKAGRYTCTNFDHASEQRQRLIVEAQIDVIQKRVMTEANQILKEIDDVLSGKDLQTKDHLQALQTRAQQLAAKVTSQENDTCAWNEMSAYVALLQRYVDDHIKFSKEMTNEREMTQQQNKQIMLMYEDKLQQQTDDHYKAIANGRKDSDDLKATSTSESKPTKMCLLSDHKLEAAGCKISQVVEHEVSRNQPGRGLQFPPSHHSYRPDNELEFDTTTASYEYSSLDEGTNSWLAQQQQKLKNLKEGQDTSDRAEQKKKLVNDGRYAQKKYYTRCDHTEEEERKTEFVEYEVIRNQPARGLQSSPSHPSYLPEYGPKFETTPVSFQYSSVDEDTNSCLVQQQQKLNNIKEGRDSSDRTEQEKKLVNKGRYTQKKYYTRRDHTEEEERKTEFVEYEVIRNQPARGLQSSPSHTSYLPEYGPKFETTPVCFQYSSVDEDTNSWLVQQQQKLNNIKEGRDSSDRTEQEKKLVNKGRYTQKKYYTRRDHTEEEERKTEFVEHEVIRNQPARGLQSSPSHPSYLPEYGPKFETTPVSFQYSSVDEDTNSWLVQQQQKLNNIKEGRDSSDRTEQEKKLVNKGRYTQKKYYTRRDHTEEEERIQMTDSNQVDLLLIGKTGNGKSATGNAILRRDAFISTCSTTSVTSKVDCEVSYFNGRIIKVVDGPGVGDTRFNPEDRAKLVMTEMEQAIVMNPRGYHAFLLVVRFGVRFTAEERDTIALLKNIFGQDFVETFCILVLTHGDEFERRENKNISFQQWCNNQVGYFKNLLRECDNRIVLFDNATKDIAKNIKQTKDLLSIVDNLSSKGERYTDENFEHAREAREHTFVELKKSIIQDETMTETSLIIQRLQELQAEEDPASAIESLRNLQARVESLLVSLSSRDRGTGVLNDLRSTVKGIKNNIKAQIELCYKMERKREKTKRREDEIRRKYEDDMKHLKEQQDLKLKEENRILEEQEKFENEMKRLKTELEDSRRKDKEELETKYKQILENHESNDKKLERALEEQRQLKEENEKLKKEMKVKIKIKREKLENKCKEQHIEIKKTNEKSEKEYKRLKGENEKGIWSQFYDGFTLPFRKFGKWLSKEK